MAAKKTDQAPDEIPDVLRKYLEGVAAKKDAAAAERDADPHGYAVRKLQNAERATPEQDSFVDFVGDAIKVIEKDLRFGHLNAVDIERLKLIAKLELRRIEEQRLVTPLMGDAVARAHAMGNVVDSFLSQSWLGMTTDEARRAFPADESVGKTVDRLNEQNSTTFSAQADHADRDSVAERERLRLANTEDNDHTAGS